MTEQEMKVSKIDLFKSWGYDDPSKLPYGEHMMIGPEPEIRQNPYSGVKVELNPVELAIYDRLMDAYHTHIDVGNAGDFKKAKILYSVYNTGKNWFIENNIDAYMELID